MRKITFWSSDMEYAAKRCMEKYPEMVRETLRTADQVCRNVFALYGNRESGADWTCFPGEEPECMYALHRHDFAVVLSKAWLYTKDVKYPIAFKYLLADWIKHVPYSEENRKVTWRVIETGIRSVNWLYALAMFGREITEDAPFIDKMRESLMVHARHLLKEDMPFLKQCTWGIWQNYGLFLLGFYFHRLAWCEFAISRLEEALKTQILDDGTHRDQSPGSLCEVLSCLLNMLSVSRKQKYDMPGYIIVRVRTMAYALALWVRPDGRTLCQAEGDGRDARDLLVESAYLYEDPLLKAYAGKEFLAKNFFSMAEKEKEYGMIPLEEREGTIALKESGNYMLWDGKKDDSCFLHMNCGCPGGEHEHGDVLHIDLYGYGDSILVDSGDYIYKRENIWRELVSSKAHNTVVIDRQEYRTYYSSWSYASVMEGLRGEHKFTFHYDYISGTHMGYLPVGIISRRRVLRIGKGMFVIWDDFRDREPGRSHYYERFFHFGCGGKLCEVKNGVIYTGEKSSSVLVFPESDAGRRIEKRPVSREGHILDEGDCLIQAMEAVGTVSMPAVIAVHPAGTLPMIRTEILPVTAGGSERAVWPDEAQALRITSGLQEWVVIMQHREPVLQKELLTAGGYRGYGRVLVFGRDDPQGTCLA